MNLLELLGVKMVRATATEAIVEIAVTDQLKQPFGVVHGGINTILAETAASLGANAGLDTTQQIAVGVNVETHHLYTVAQGRLRANAKPLHAGKRLQTWQVEVHEQASARLTSVSTVTLMITARQ
ncbi:PaaI family thioesterase [Loigolactobacillus coryniformis]|uniref:PaaI family thioesterase n=1 Tax=Loigolactobacillus coryniformis TaxID=1610 RepID=UPI00201AF73A|nr:PaaI family thioesterase [Loigolactobacillus coryniformis]MCL5459045.1 PaaI family thioesterase [Loigolactobacillus coryniformis]